MVDLQSRSRLINRAIERKWKLTNLQKVPFYCFSQGLKIVQIRYKSQIKHKTHNASFSSVAHY